MKKITEEDKINLATKHIIQNDDFVTPFLQRKIRIRKVKLYLKSIMLRKAIMKIFFG